MQIKDLTNLKINKLTPSQYKTLKAAGNIKEDEIYLTGMESQDLSDFISKDYIITISNSWNGTEPLYTQNVQCTGIKSVDKPIIDLIISTTEYEVQEAEWNKIIKAETYNDGIKFYAKEKTSINLSVQIKVVK